VAGWASVNQGTEGPPIWDVVASHVSAQQVVRAQQENSIKVRGI
jgi:sulfur-oxidizing protein SoxB